MRVEEIMSIHLETCRAEGRLLPLVRRTESPPRTRLEINGELLAPPSELREAMPLSKAPFEE